MLSARRLLGAHLPVPDCLTQFAIDVRLHLPATCPDCGFRPICVPATSFTVFSDGCSLWLNRPSCICRSCMAQCLYAAGRRGSGARDAPATPDAGSVIAKMKNGRTHLAHKAEHGVDMDTGAIVSVTVQDASDGDTSTLPATLIMAAEQVEVVQPDNPGVEEVVADKGYHSDETLVALGAVGVRSHVSEPVPPTPTGCWASVRLGTSQTAYPGRRTWSTTRASYGGRRSDAARNFWPGAANSKGSRVLLTRCTRWIPAAASAGTAGNLLRPFLSRRIAVVPKRPLHREVVGRSFDVSPVISLPSKN